MTLLGWGCSSSSSKSETGNQKSQSENVQKTSDGLTPFQLKNGIGPITQEVKVGPLDQKLVSQGEDLFENKCSSCHKIGQRYVGPDLKEVTSRRTPAYIMNMMMNPEGMIQKHPVAHKLLEKFATPMANMHVTKDQARAIVEYFRSVNPNTQK
jgi:mono/diheme cytochrome c family protein